MLILPQLSITGGLPRTVFSLDAGLSGSYAGGGSQSWDNIAIPVDGESQSAYDFDLGATSGASTDDPTFNGTAGNNSASEYFSGDGGDFFELSSTNTTFVKGLHKDNAKFTFAFFVKTPTTLSGVNPNVLLSTGNNTNTAPAIDFVINASGNVDLIQTNGTSQQSVGASSGTVSNNTKYLIAVSYDEASGDGIIYINNGTKAATSFTQTYTSASATDPAHSLRLMANSGVIMPSGWNLWRVDVWNTNLSENQLDSLFNTYKSKLGL